MRGVHVLLYYIYLSGLDSKTVVIKTLGTPRRRTYYYIVMFEEHIIRDGFRVPVQIIVITG